MSGRNPTSFDIAYRAGVSQSTVSRALRDSPLVSAKTRAKVQAIAKELNYQVDRSASNLRRGSARTLALLLAQDAPDKAALINPFFLSMLGSLTTACAARDYDLLINLQQPGDDWYARYEVSHRADGLILLGYGDYRAAEPNLRRLIDDGAHWIMWGPELHLEGSAFVGCDNREGGRIAARHLQSLGRNKIVFLGRASVDCPELAARYAGLCEVIGSVKQSDAHNDEQSGAAAVASLLAAGHRPDALVCASDLIAIGAMNYLIQQGFDVPGQISVIGFDDIDIASYCSPALTTLRQDVTLAGQTLVELLLEQIEQNTRRSQLLAPKLIVRQSCGR